MIVSCSLVIPRSIGAQKLSLTGSKVLIVLTGCLQTKDLTLDPAGLHARISAFWAEGVLRTTAGLQTHWEAPEDTSETQLQKKRTAMSVQVRYTRDKV